MTASENDSLMKENLASKGNRVCKSCMIIVKEKLPRFPRRTCAYVCRKKPCQRRPPSFSSLLFGRSSAAGKNYRPSVVTGAAVWVGSNSCKVFEKTVDQVRVMKACKPMNSSSISDGVTTSPAQSAHVCPQFGDWTETVEVKRLNN